MEPRSSFWPVLLITILLVGCSQGYSKRQELLQDEHHLQQPLPHDEQPPHRHRLLESARIVGGDDAEQDRYPYFVWLDLKLYSGEYSSCGGTLVASDWVLTAAHCFDDNVEDIFADVNAYDLDDTFSELSTPVVNVIQHPDWNVETKSFDVMLVQLRDPISSNDVEPVELNGDPQVPMVGQEVRVLGFGSLEEKGEYPERLQQVDVDIIDFDDCNEGHDYMLEEDEHLCAAAPGKDACGGDSGGPLLIVSDDDDGPDVQAGIVSFGIGCAVPGIPGVYAPISNVIDWIDGVLCSASETRPRRCNVTPSPTGVPTSSPTTRLPTSSPTSSPTTQDSPTTPASPTTTNGEPTTEAPTIEPATMEPTTTAPTATTSIAPSSTAERNNAVIGINRPIEAKTVASSAKTLRYGAVVGAIMLGMHWAL